MKTLSTILAAAFIAGSCGLAMAQAGGDTNPNKGATRGADQNPTGAANPAAGNPGGAPGANMHPGGMTTAPVAGRPAATGNGAATNSMHNATGSETGTAKDPAGPAGERGVSGSGGSK